MESGTVAEHAEPEAGATYAKKIDKAEARIDWSKPAREIDCLIRGLSPFPGAWCEAKGERLKVLFAKPAAGHGMPGEILDDTLTVACGEGALNPLPLKGAGGKTMSAGELLRGFPLIKGASLS